MGANLDCALFFGYDIGGHDTEEGEQMFATYNAETYTHTWPEWVKSIDPDEEDWPDDLSGDIEDVLLTKMTDFEVIDWDYTGSDPRPDDYYTRLRDAKKELGFEFDTYGTDGNSGTVFGFCLAQGDWGVQVVEPSKLTGIPFNLMRLQLRRALTHLGIAEEDQPDPKLMLISSYF